jgi:hypothetical protein
MRLTMVLLVDIYIRSHGSELEKTFDPGLSTQQVTGPRLYDDTSLLVLLFTVIPLISDLPLDRTQAVKSVWINSALIHVAFLPIHQD